MLNKNKRELVENNLLEVNNVSRKDYERRLSVPYDNGKRSFMKQFKDGSGSELEKKFWSKRSSSRLCFDLYSWIANEGAIIEFEKKLPRLGAMGKPNMDVFIETDSAIWYIESKFTETVDNSRYGITLPEAYWKEVDETGLEKVNGGFHTTKNEYRPTTILERYKKDERLQIAFQNFCKETAKYASELSENECIEWFDAKQETCHLLGVILDIRNRLQNKDFCKEVHFANIVFSFNEPESPFAKDFLKRAESLVKELTGLENFHYNVFTMQDVLNKYGNKLAYESNGLTVSQQINNTFGRIFDLHE